MHSLPPKMKTWAAAHARNNKLERRAEEDRMENERLAAKKLQNQDLAHENAEDIRVKDEGTGQNNELTKVKDDLF
jgi:hypothetical protein